jgi:FtsH-binding integral membrane protein
VIAIVSAVTVASMVPMIFAWQRSSNSTGSTADVDFWLLIQTSVLQLLGLFTTIYPMPKHSTATAWLWAIVFTVLGSVCVFAAIPVYLYISTMWSAFSSFIGSAAQLSMTLQLALIADSRFTPVKEE